LSIAVHLSLVTKPHLLYTSSSIKSKANRRKEAILFFRPSRLEDERPLLISEPQPFFGRNAMKCPVDDTELVMSDRQGIEIDYCPKCRGVWLDRGELDKIIERSSPDERPRQSYSDDRHRHHDQRSYDRQPYKKKKSLLGDIFDF
jgi:uncharacterized protein